MNFELGFYDALSIVSYGLLTLSYAMRDIVWLRVITMGGCFVDLVVYSFIRPGQPMWVQLGFNVLILAVNAWQLWVLYRERSIADLPDDAAALYRSAFAFLSPVEFRRVYALGRRRELADGEALLEAGQPAGGVAVVTRGRLDVALHGHPIAQVEAGAFAGEVSFLTDRPASADARAAGPAQVFELPRTALVELLARHPELKAKLEGVWGRLLADRLRSLTDKVDFVWSGTAIARMRA